MSPNNKKFRTNPVHDIELHPVPPILKKCLDLVGGSFNNTHMRNLAIMNQEPGMKLYGFMTNYFGGNFFWIQPTRIKSFDTDVEYDKYMVRVQKDARDDKLKFIDEIREGLDCLAQYEVDMRWYRATVIEKLPDDKWLVLFVDFGNFQPCHPFRQLRAIISEPKCDHFHAPMQAVCCRLYNVVPIMPENREKIDDYLEKFYAKHVSDFLEIEVRNIRQDYVVDCDVFLSKGLTAGTGIDRLYQKHLGQELVDTGVATFASPEAAHAIKHHIDYVKIE